MQKARKELVICAIHYFYKHCWIQTGSGVDCTHNMYSTARDPSSSDIFSLTDSCVYIWEAWCTTRTRQQWERIQREREREGERERGVRFHRLRI